MTTQAECTLVAPIVQKHSTKAQGDGQQSAMVSAAATLAAIGAGTITQNATPAIQYSMWAAAEGAAAQRALSNGNPDEAIILQNAKRILTNLSQGI
jgi:hypothetical protein